MAKNLITDSRFSGFFCAQFFGAFNDNLLKFAVTLAVTYNDQLRGDTSAGLLINLIAAIFILPFFLFSATSGQLADKYDKAKIMRFAKLLEPPIVILTAAGFALGNLSLLILAVFLLGAQSSFFGPAKYAFLPEQMKPHELVMANALVESATFVAILLGTMAAGSIMSQPDRIDLIYIVCGVGFLASLVGLYGAFKIPATPSHHPDLKVNWNVLTETARNVKAVYQLKRVRNSLFGISWLWFVGATYLTQFPLLTRNVLNADASVATFLLICFTIGLAAGAWLCEKMSAKKVEMGLIVWGLIVMTLAGAGLHFSLLEVDASGPAQTLIQFLSSPINLLITMLFIAVSAGIGLYSVPLYASMQVMSPRHQRSQVVAANNIINSFFMVMSAGFAIAVLAIAQGNVVWVFSAVTAINTLVLIFWIKKDPFTWMRARLLWRVMFNRQPHLENAEALDPAGGNLIVFPTLLHEEYLRRLAGLPVRYSVVLSGRLPGGRFVEWLRRNEFIFEFNKLSELPSQKELIKRIAIQIQKGDSIAIDRPMFELLKKNYRLDDLPALLAKKGVAMHVVELHEDKNNALPLIWRLKKRQIQPA